jgi:protein-L-isoaspartate(D-aspartate) O-methyltransferase
MATGRLLTELHPQRGEHALVVGAATGYSAALLTEMGLKVVALEEDPDLVAIAQSANVKIVQGSLASGRAGEAPYDLILIDGAVEFLPEALISQLAAKGRLATGLIDGGVMRLAIGRRSAHGFGLQPFADADMAVLPGFTKPKGFSF